MNEPKSTLAERLRRLRISKGYASAREFAKALEIAENRYSRYERGEAVPKIEVIWAICSKLGVTPNELYGLTPVDDPSPRGAGSPSLAQQAGFGEDSAMLDDVTSPAARGPAPDGASRSLSLSRGDRAAWRLAAALADAVARPSPGLAPQAPSLRLGSMRATADVFLKLKRDPLATLAKILQSAEMQSLPADVEARVTGEIEAFLTALDGGDADID